MTPLCTELINGGSGLVWQAERANEGGQGRPMRCELLGIDNGSPCTLARWAGGMVVRESYGVRVVKTENMMAKKKCGVMFRTAAPEDPFGGD